MKKTIAILSIIFMFLIVDINVSATECEINDNDFETVELEDETLSIIKYNGNCNSVLIPEMVNNKKVSSISESAFNNDNISNVSVLYDIDVFDSLETFSENITLKGLKDSKIVNYAKKYNRNYKEIYTINYYFDNNKTVYVESDKYIINVDNPTKDYYYFIGWKTDNDIYNYGDTIDVNDNIYLTPVWENNNYYINFNANGGTGKMEKIMLSADKEYVLPSVLFSKKNYKFYGWNTKEDGSGTHFNNNDTIKNLTKDNNGEITLYAMWGNKSVITFDSKGGSKIYTTKTVYYNNEIGTLPIPKRKGYKFIGWYNNTNQKIESHTLYPYKSNIKLYAHWEKIKYNINYSLVGQNNESNITQYTITTSFKLLSPKRVGYKFSGWYKDSKKKKRITKITKGSTGNLTLYASWTPIKYNISFNANGGSGKMNKIYNVKYDKNVTLSKNKFKKTGYSFVGWNTKEDGSGTFYSNSQVVKNLTSTSGKTVKLYAQWKIINYTITYDFGDNNTYELSNPTTYTINDTITLNNPEKEGYLFLGWRTDSSLSTKLTTIKKGTTGNKILYAKWVEYNPDSDISKTRIFMVDLAQSQLGNYNGKKYWTWYGSKVRMAWCCVFVSWLADQNGVLNKAYPKFAAVPVGEKYFKSKGQYKKRGTYTPLPGDIIFFDWNHNGGLDHVGIVESVSGNYIYAIEGNSTNRVARRKYLLTSKDINGYGIPNYD